MLPTYLRVFCKNLILVCPACNLRWLRKDTFTFLITFLKVDLCFVDNNIAKFLLIFLLTTISRPNLQNQFIIMKSLIAIVFLLTNQGTLVCSLCDRAHVFFNKAYKNAQRQLRGNSSSSRLNTKSSSYPRSSHFQAHYS